MSVKAYQDLNAKDGGDRYKERSTSNRRVRGELQQVVQFHILPTSSSPPEPTLSEFIGESEKKG